MIIFTTVSISDYNNNWSMWIVTRHRDFHQCFAIHENNKIEIGSYTSWMKETDFFQNFLITCINILIILRYDIFLINISNQKALHFYDHLNRQRPKYKKPNCYHKSIFLKYLTAIWLSSSVFNWEKMSKNSSNLSQNKKNMTQKINRCNDALHNNKLHQYVL